MSFRLWQPTCSAQVRGRDHGENNQVLCSDQLTEKSDSTARLTKSKGHRVFAQSVGSPPDAISE